MEIQNAEIPKNYTIGSIHFFCEEGIFYRKSTNEVRKISRHDFENQWRRIEAARKSQNTSKDPPIIEQLPVPAIFHLSDQELQKIPSFEQDDVKNWPGPLTEQAEKKALLEKLLDCEKALQAASRKPVVFSPPLVSFGETVIFGRGTVNIIQGPAGSHKSRLGESFASFLLSHSTDNHVLGFKKQPFERFCVAHIDSERNLSEELPFAIQTIKKNAGFSIEEIPDNFRFTSLKSIERENRFEAIERFLNNIRQQTSLHLFSMIDVVTDAVSDFNDAKQSMRLYDFVGNLCDQHNATFLLVIHQNPGTEKARGHAGTEGINKSATVIQISYVRNAKGEETELIRVRFLKIRRGKRPDPLYLKFCDQTKSLRLADPDEVSEVLDQRKKKADSEELADRLVNLLSAGPLQKGEVWKQLENDFSASNATIRARLSSMLGKPLPMIDDSGRTVTLAESRTGQTHFYSLAPIED